MSIEQALAENTAAINNLAAILSTQGGEGLASPKADKPAGKTATTKTTTKKTTNEAAVETAADVSYDDVKTRVLELSKAFGRDTTVDVLSRFGVGKAPDLTEDQYGDFIAKADAVLAGEKV